MDFSDDLYGVSHYLLMISILLQVVNIGLMIEWQVDEQVKLQWKERGSNAAEPVEALARVPIFGSAQEVGCSDKWSKEACEEGKKLFVPVNM